MRHFHYVEIENFKRFEGSRRIDLDHPAVLIGPNNCGKTSVLQALALWSHAVRTWRDAKAKSKPRKRPATALNRLAITAVPVKRTRYFWHNQSVHSGQSPVPMSIAVGVEYNGRVCPLRMRFRHHGDELVYCYPEEEALKVEGLVDHAARIGVELLYPMSGLVSEEPLLKPGRIDVLLGQGETAQVLRNLCLMVHSKSRGDWGRIKELVRRLFSVTLGDPSENERGSIDLSYEQGSVKGELDVSVSGRGFQQVLLILSYLFSHKGSVLLIDEPDAHLEILRQRQVLVLLRELAADCHSQVVIVTHSEVILEEGLGTNLTLILGGVPENLAERKTIKTALRHFGAEHYVRAQERGYVLYVEGQTDLAALRAMGEVTRHPVIETWDHRPNVYYVQDNYPGSGLDRDLERVEGAFGLAPREHFGALRSLIPNLKGLAILDSDRARREAVSDGQLEIAYWDRYEVENYFISPGILKEFALRQYADMELFDRFEKNIDDVLDSLTLSRIFGGNREEFNVYAKAPGEAAGLIWRSRSERIKLSEFAEEFFRMLAEQLSMPMLLRKGELHRLIPLLRPEDIPAEVTSKLDLLARLFKSAVNRE